MRGLFFMTTPSEGFPQPSPDMLCCFVFRVGLYTSSSCANGEQSGMGITNVADKNGTYTDVVVISEGLLSVDTTADCTDCDPGVCRFTLCLQY